MPPPRTIVALLLAAACGCSRKEEAAPPAANPTLSKSTRFAAVLSDSVARAGPLLLTAAAERRLELVVESRPDGVDAQLDAMRKALDSPTAALLATPMAPEPLQRMRQLAATKQVPMVSLLRGDGRSGSWVGVRSSTLAKEAGEWAGAWLKSRGHATPRVVVVEDVLWPETRRRAEATLRGLESACGAIDLPVRFDQPLAHDEMVAELVGSLKRLGKVDVLVATDVETTAAACEAAKKSTLADSLAVVGATDDPTLVAAARTNDAKLLLVVWKAEDAARLAVEALEEAAKRPDAEVQREVPCELVGLGVSAPKKDGS